VIARFKEQPRLNSALAAICVALIVFGVLAVDPASQSSGQSTRIATVQRGVVQSTVSGTGNVEAASQLNLGFKTSGTVTHIYVKQGQHVTKGQLLATVDPQSAEVTLEQARASLQSAEANIAKAEEGGEASSTQASSASGAGATTATVAYVASSAAATGTTTSPGTTTTNTTTTSPSTTTNKTTATSPSSTSSPSMSTQSKGTTSGPSTTTGATSSGTSSSGGGGQGTGSSEPTQSAATREANLASARAAAKSAELTVQSDEKALQNTKLYAPENGTIVALSGEVGETVAGTGTTKASSATASSSGSSSSGSSSSGGASSGGSSATGGSSSTTSSASSSTPFAVLSSLESMQLVVPLSESEIGNVKAGQTATVTIEALSGRKLAAHVLSIDQLPTSTSGVVSYDVTFQLDQGASGVKTGMSATAEVVVKQEEGLNVPTSAVSRGSVTVVRGGKHVSQPVTTGLVGSSSTIVLSGLKAGEEVLLPTATATSSGSSTRARTGALGGGLGGAGGGGGFAGGGLGGGGLGGGGATGARGG
jgi:multidrug efflux pump subunit AcrA (membrane-fusion protein)